MGPSIYLLMITLASLVVTLSLQVMSPTPTHRVLPADNEFNPSKQIYFTLKNHFHQPFFCLLSKLTASAHTNHLLQKPTKHQEHNKQAIIGEEKTHGRLQNLFFLLEIVSKTPAKLQPEDTTFQSDDIIKRAELQPKLEQLANFHRTHRYNSCVHNLAALNNHTANSTIQSKPSPPPSSHRHIICLLNFLIHPTLVNTTY